MILKSARNAPKKSWKVAKIDFGFEGGYNNVKNKIYIRLFNIKLPALSVTFVSLIYILLN